VHDDGTVVPGTADRRRERLDSWKQIAAYLERGVTTVQRWEQEEGLPIHRLPHAKKGSVFAFKSELDAWHTARARTALTPVEQEVRQEQEPPASLNRRRWAAAGIVGAALGALVISWGLGQALLVRDGIGEMATTTPRPFANDAAIEDNPSLSPDGDQVVFYWARRGAQGLYIKSIAGGEPRLLLRATEGVIRHPHWSPRGDLIAFLSIDAENRRAVHVIAPSGGSPRRLTSASGLGLCWTPDGESVGFVDWNVEGEPLSIFKVSVATGQRVRLTMPPRGTFGDTHCAFSADGRRLAVTRFISRYQSDVHVLAASGETGFGQRLTHDFEPMEGLAWTPDGRSIVVGSDRGLSRIAVGTGDQRQEPTLLIGGAKMSYPTFSPPTGEHPARLVYVSQIHDVNLWRVDRQADGSTAVHKVEGSLRWEDHPAISPGGRRVAFVSNRSGSAEIWTANLDGSQPRQVTFYRGPIVISPSWSPDGQQLAYTSQVGGNRDVHIAGADGTKARRLTWETSQEENPSWSRDGRWIYFRSDREGVGQIWKAPAAGGSPTKVTESEASQAMESPDGTLLYFVRKWDVPGIWSVPVVGGKETLVAPDVSEALWAVADRGITFVQTSPKLSPEGPTLRFFDFDSGKVSVTAKIEGTAPILPGFTVSRDGRSIIFTRLDRAERDLMLVDPWIR
jgi:Tol biopolymer transport system component